MVGEIVAGEATSLPCLFLNEDQTVTTPTPTTQKPIDHTMLTRYRKLLWDSEEPRMLPESLIEMHHRQYGRMRKVFKIPQLSADMQGMIVMLWEQTTDEGQAFVCGKEVINWGALNVGTKLVVVIKDDELEAEFVSDATRFQINVRLPGDDKLTRVAKSTARLAVA